jgi:glycerate kinase
MYGMNSAKQWLIAPGPFKECLSSVDVAEALTRGLLRVFPSHEFLKLPVCDGGSGFLDRLVSARHGSIETVQVYDPTGEPIQASYGILEQAGTRIGIIESAQAAGLKLVPKPKREPLRTSTFGVAQLVRAAIKNGCKEILLGCGDSATNDGGVGLATALGVRFLDRNGKELPPGGGELWRLERIDMSHRDPLIANVKITVACNLTSILCGKDGTSRVYGPQKGATLEVVEILEKSLDRYAEVIERDFGVDIRFIPGCGAAGGLAAALFVFFGAKIRFSMSIVEEFLSLETAIRSCDIVVTGEGTVDARTITGKVAGYLGLVAKRYDKPVVAFCGAATPEANWAHYFGIDAIIPTTPGPISAEDSIKQSVFLIEEAALRFGRTIGIGRRLV